MIRRLGMCPSCGKPLEIQVDLFEHRGAIYYTICSEGCPFDSKEFITYPSAQEFRDYVTGRYDDQERRA